MDNDIRRFSPFLAAVLFALAGGSAWAQALPDEVQVGTREIKDFEFDTAREGVYCPKCNGGAGNSRHVQSRRFAEGACGNCPSHLSSWTCTTACVPIECRAFGTPCGRGLKAGPALLGSVRFDTHFQRLLTGIAPVAI